MRNAVYLLAILMVCGDFGHAQLSSFRGTVVRMEMIQCTQEHGFVSAMSGSKVVTSRICPEYTVITEKAVYVLVSRKADQFMPLGEDVTFSVKDGEVTVANQDEKSRSRFAVHRMMLREDWERSEHQRHLSLPCSIADPTVSRGVLLQTAEQ